MKELIEELIKEKKYEEDIREFTFRCAKESFNITANRYIKFKDYVNGIESFEEFQRVMYIKGDN